MNMLNKLNPKYSLRAEIAWVSGAMVLLLSTALSFYAADASKRRIEQSEGESFVRRAQTALDVLDRGMYERSREIRNASQLDEMRDSKVPLLLKRELMERLQQNFDAYAWIGFCGPDGKGLAGTGGYLEGKDLSKRPWCTEGRKGDYIGDVHDALLLAKLLPNPSGETFYLVDVASPVLDRNNNLLGVLCGHIYWTWASEALDSKLTPGQDIFLLSSKGQVLSGPEAAWSDFGEMAPVTMRHIRSGAKSGHHIERFSNGRTYLVGHATSSGYRDYKGFGWTALVREDITSAFAPARALQYRILGVGASLGLLFAWLSWTLAARISSPVRAISKAAGSVAAGNLDHPLPQFSREDEIGNLSRDLAAMVKRLRYEGEQLKLAALVFGNNSEAVMISDVHNHIITVNRAFTEITGYSESEVLGQNPRLFASGHHDQKFYRDLWQAVLEQGCWRGEMWNRRKNGEVYPEWLSITLVRDERGDVTHHIGIFLDITERKRREEKMGHLANFDQITDLPNRTLLNDRMEQTIASIERRGGYAAVLFIDLDHFKQINDSLGHDLGDVLLKQLTLRLHNCLRRSDTLARFGGDEFVVLLTDVKDGGEAAMVAEKMLASLKEPLDVSGHSLHVAISIGIALCPDDGVDTVSLLRNADLAMYRAKESGRGRYAFYEEEMTQKAGERLRLETELREAIAGGQLQLYYQPKLSAQDNRLLGIEALLRWKHPEFGFVSPATFIPVAEQSGLIHEISEWVLRQAVMQQRLWQAQGFEIVPVAVNLSVAQFQRPGLAEGISRIVQEGGLKACWIELELTEGMLLELGSKNIEVLNRLHDAGFAIALDDFGTGYSSLSRLKRLPISYLKIDQNFVRDIVTDASDRSIVSATVALAHALNLRVIAEGVEHSDQLDFIRSIGCDEYQGYLFSKPVPAEEVVRFLNRKEG